MKTRLCARGSFFTCQHTSLAVRDSLFLFRNHPHPPTIPHHHPHPPCPACLRNRRFGREAPAEKSRDRIQAQRRAPWCFPIHERSQASRKIPAFAPPPAKFPPPAFP